MLTGLHVDGGSQWPGVNECKSPGHYCAHLRASLPSDLTMCIYCFVLFTYLVCAHVWVFVCVLAYLCVRVCECANQSTTWKIWFFPANMKVQLKLSGLAAAGFTLWAILRAKFIETFNPKKINGLSMTETLKLYECFISLKSSWKQQCSAVQNISYS